MEGNFSSIFSKALKNILFVPPTVTSPRSYPTASFEVFLSILFLPHPTAGKTVCHSHTPVKNIPPIAHPQYHNPATFY